MQLQNCYTMDGCKVMLQGNQPTIVQIKRAESSINQPSLTEATKRAELMSADSDKVYLLRVASDVGYPGFQTIIDEDAAAGQSWTAADGMILKKPGSATVFQTNDCPAVIMNDRRSNLTIAAHCGRPALTPRGGQNIITKMLNVIAPAKSDLQQIEVYITGSIAGKDFAHNRTCAIRDKAKPFLDEYGAQVFTDVDSLQLDLTAVISTVCIERGINPRHISSDGLNTFDEVGLSSNRKRAQDNLLYGTMNTIVVTKQ